MTTPEQPEQIDREAANSILYCAIPDSFTVHGQFKLDLAAVAEALAAHRRLGIEQGKRMAGGEVEPGSYPKSVWYTPEDNSSRLYIRDDIAQGWEEACKNLIAGSADDRDRSILLADLLKRAREYVTDALDAHEHSDGRYLLNEIDAALTEQQEENP